MPGRQMPFGAEIVADGVRFSLWAPDADHVALVIDECEPLDVARDRDGMARVTIPEAGPGTRYSWMINGRRGIPDPASRFQPEGVLAPSMVTDPASFEWRHVDWRGRPWEDALIYELHVGTATTKGTYEGLIERLDALHDLGVTMIELMPLAECPGQRNWGYDGVLPYAPNSAYGSPDDLKRLIDEAHGRGMMVMLDVVYNHFGPSGNFLSLYAKSFFTERHHTPWGAAIDFDAQHRRMVREFFIHNAIYWIDEFQFDGLRLDAVHAICDESETHILSELAERVRGAAPSREIHLVLENERNAASWLERSPAGKPQYYNAQWNDDIHHCWHVLLTNEAEAYYRDFVHDTRALLGRCLAQGFAYQGESSLHAGGAARGEPSAHLPPQAFVAFLQNHDQIGNRAFGERLSALANAQRLPLAYAGLILSPQIPMLFMGEDWAASTPFQFFVDFSHDADLSKAVRDGRRREFEKFAAFAGDIPDPTDVSTFAASTLRWEERIHSPHAEMLAGIRDLIALRRKHVIPLLRSGWINSEHASRDDGGLDLHWRFAGGDLRFFLHFGDKPRQLHLSAMQQAIWTNARAENKLDFRLAPWTGIATVEAARGARR